MTDLAYEQALVRRMNGLIAEIEGHLVHAYLAYRRYRVLARSANPIEAMHYAGLASVYRDLARHLRRTLRDER